MFRRKMLKFMAFKQSGAEIAATEEPATIGALDLACYVLAKVRNHFDSTGRSNHHTTPPQLQKILLLTSFFHDFLSNTPLVSDKPEILIDGALKRLVFSDVYTHFGHFGKNKIPNDAHVRLTNLTRVENALSQEQKRIIDSVVNSFANCPCYVMSEVGRDYIADIEKSKDHAQSAHRVIANLLDKAGITEQQLKLDFSAAIDAVSAAMNKMTPTADIYSRLELLAYQEFADLIQRIESDSAECPAMSASEALELATYYNENPESDEAQYFNLVAWPRYNPAAAEPESNLTASSEKGTGVETVSVLPP